MKLGPRKTNLHVVTGPLGAGKTTLIAKLLRRLDRTAVRLLVNEFGGFPIDQHTLGEVADRVEAITGCICCGPTGDVLAALEELCGEDSSGAPSDVIIETSGLADIRFLAADLTSDLRFLRRFDLASTILVLDGSDAVARVHDDPELSGQIAVCDAVFLAHLDRVYAPELGGLRLQSERALRSLNEGLLIFHGDHGVAELASAMSCGRFLRRASNPWSSIPRSGRGAGAQLVSRTFSLSVAMSLQECRELAGALALAPAKLCRLKMLCPLSDFEGSCLINMTLGRPQGLTLLGRVSIDVCQVYMIGEGDALAAMEDFVRFHLCREARLEALAKAPVGG